MEDDKKKQGNKDDREGGVGVASVGGEAVAQDQLYCASAGPKK